MTYSIRARREARDWNAEDLARRTGLTGKTVRQVERGQRKPHWGTLRLIAHALDCEPDDLLTSDAPGMPTERIVTAVAGGGQREV